MQKENIHIGTLIKERMKELHISPTELAKRLGYSLPGTTSIFERKTMQTDVLLMVCKALDYDFFKHYTEEGTGDGSASSPQAGGRGTEEQKKLEEKIIEREKEILDLKKELEYLKKIVGLYEEKKGGKI